MTLLVLNVDINFMGNGKGKSEKIISHVFKSFKELEIGP